MPQTLDKLLEEIRACTVCEGLPLGPRPVLQASGEARILVAAQAPGVKVHETGLPFDDASGERLRAWMGVSRETFYDARLINVVPMGFCYPGKSGGGDSPPRPECRRTWHDELFRRLPKICLKLVIGQYAHAYHLGRARKQNLTATVKAWREFWPDVVPLPHPSPRNFGWFMRNPWFEQELVPRLRRRVREILENR